MVASYARDQNEGALVILLLDSHALLWALHAPGKLKPVARQAIEDGGNAVLFSAASVWEIAIKAGKRLLEIETVCSKRFMRSVLLNYQCAPSTHARQSLLHPFTAIRLIEY